MIPFRDDNPTKRFPIVTVLLIAANLAVFVYQFTLSEAELARVVYRFGMVPRDLTALDPGLIPVFGTSLFTSMFLHGGVIHLLGNMWYLWIFGDNIEDRMGPFRFLIFYLVCGLLAAFVHVGFNPGSGIPTIGASGAVAGVLGAYLVSYPFARVLTLVPLLIFWPVIELPALIVLGSWFIVQLFNGTMALTGAAGGGIAFWAHIGGFMAGVFLIGAFARREIPRFRSSYRATNVSE